MVKHKRERSVNFTHEETDLLVSLVEAKKQIIENKKSDAATWQDKEKAWKEIETAFNASSGSVFRNHKHLKLKYEAMKKDIRKKRAMIRADRCKTGGGMSTTPVLTRAEQKVQEMIRLSIEENESSDSDVVLPCNQKPKEKKPMDKLIEEKFEIAKIQKQIVIEELEQKLLQRKILEKELKHKDVMHELEQQHLLLKIEFLKKNLRE
ncbi:unnamed protein product [Arctia plantaginis]|uniref:Regulatory protein zeste n=1 Tax=Arctia plantaginis TaxID=874455 RepID=A0A8S0ZE08_ARCPL|nr:unnamed protein product [Arctia plantaginis]CAB3234347.1 unnamed protein product [Arctia plantaginis]